MQRDAHLSADGQYRYSLTRRWGAGRSVCFIGLNPSTADHQIDDPTIRRCIGFARTWGFEALEMVNLFALRATDPKVMRQSADPEGPLADDSLIQAMGRNELTIACWGVHGSHRARDARVRELIGTHGHELHHLGLTKAGLPRHPLYLRSETMPTIWVP